MSGTLMGAEEMAAERGEVPFLISYFIIECGIAGLDLFSCHLAIFFIDWRFTAEKRHTNERLLHEHLNSSYILDIK